MSFTSEIKQELTYNDLKDCCKKAELSALVQLLSSLSISNSGMCLLIKCENPTTSRRIMSLIKDKYDYDVELIKEKKTNLRKNNVYVIKVLSGVSDILNDLGLYSVKGLLDYPLASIVYKECCARAYLAGAFLAFGSCNAPSKNSYHLELSFNSLEHAHFLIKILNRFELKANVFERRNKYVVYIKKADSISDFLRCIGAHESLLNFENARIQRDFRNSLTRLDNCEIANEMKTIKTATKQVEAMSKIFTYGRYDSLNNKLKQVIDLRMANQEASLIELCGAFYEKYNESISKSGMRHRLNKIMKIAEEL